MKILSHAILVGAFVVAAVAAARQSPVPVGPVRIHADSAAMQQGLTDALRAFVVADAPAVRKALDAVEDNCRRLGPDEQPGYPATVVSWDTAFHGDLDATRELAARALLDRAYDRYTFLPRGCLGCHAAAAKAEVPGLPGVKH